MQLTRVTALALVLASLAACDDKGKSPSPSPSASLASASVPAPATPPGPHEGPKTQKEIPTTSPNIAVRNLDSQIDGYTEMVRKDPKNVALQRSLAGVHMQRAKYKGDLDEMQLANDLADRAVAADPKDSANYLTRANMRQTLHHFADAQKDLDQAKKLGAKEDKLAPLQAELDWNAGRYDSAIAYFRAAYAKQKSYGTASRLGQLEHDLGQETEADKLFDEAESYIRDTNAFLLTYFYVMRGMAKYQRGDLDLAAAYFREASNRLPEAVAPLDHLGETLAEMGKTDEAIAAYEKLTKLSDDPEFMGALSKLYKKKGRDKDAADLLAKAVAGYKERLKKFPDAMYWHASAFFLKDADDPKQALALLEKNLTLRPNSTSYVALARAQLATGDATGAKASIDKALAMPLVNAQLYWTAARVYAKSGDMAKAKDFEAKAKPLDAHIEEREGAVVAGTAPAASAAPSASAH